MYTTASDARDVKRGTTVPQIEEAIASVNRDCQNVLDRVSAVSGKIMGPRPEKEHNAKLAQIGSAHLGDRLLGDVKGIAEIIASVKTALVPIEQFFSEDEMSNSAG